jgi:putative endonuclease
MWYVYVLQSKINQSLYIGCTNNLRERFKKHNTGKSKYTADFRPWKLLYYEAGLNRKDAFRREKYLKSGYGRRWLKNRLKNHLENVSHSGNVPSQIDAGL